MSQRAWSLLELVVAAALLSLVLLVATMVFRPALRSWTEGQQRSEAQQVVAVTSRWLESDVVAARPDSLGWQQDQLLLARADEPPRYDSFGWPLYDRVVSYWLDEEGALHRQLASLPADTEPAPLARDPSSRVVARHLVTFDCEVRGSLLLLKLESDQLGNRCRLETSFSSRLTD